ncbi:hypothetical protein DAETH_45290 (plasmid) [Deinococcus aetherius]|uniref:DAGKc domain-containing protein n=1 Tax=Deinococcus aetherius TaxID=200252 RepID=A0ABN6RML9_9DEIO|nr:diacylglycerol kinase family protein [Deinococcus aetherius]BDP44560.1 hypothetical protein DAETH_45290 [Deinococcus aetherius]
MEDPTRAEALLRTEVARGAPLVVGGGGDGTLSHAAGRLAGTNTALGVLPRAPATPLRAASGCPSTSRGRRA